MIRKIVLEMEAEGSESLAEQITRMMLDRVDLSGEFSLQQEIIPEDISEKKVPRMPAVQYEKKADTYLPAEGIHEPAGKGNAGGSL